MVNAEIINMRVNELNENIVMLEELRAVPFDKFSEDPKKFKLARYCLQISIQCLLDICHHIIVDSDWQRPKSNQEAIEIVAGKKVIPPDFAKRVLPLVGLRNILVHEYLAVNNRLLYDNLRNLQDFRDFQKHILAYLKKVAE